MAISMLPGVQYHLIKIKEYGWCAPKYLIKHFVISLLEIPSHLGPFLLFKDCTTLSIGFHGQIRKFDNQINVMFHSNSPNSVMP